MAARTQKCSECLELLVETWVHTNGAMSRTLVVQCPNHCDLKCPRCNESVTVTSSRLSKKYLKCKYCEWRGNCPDRQFAKSKEPLKLEAEQDEILLKRRETRRQKIRKKVATDELSVGSKCPFCGLVLLQLKNLELTSKLGNDFRTIGLSCGDTACDSKWWVDIKVDHLLKMHDLYIKPETSETSETTDKCESCGQPILHDGRCGCS